MNSLLPSHHLDSSHTEKAQAPPPQYEDQLSTPQYIQPGTYQQTDQYQPHHNLDSEAATVHITDNSFEPQTAATVNHQHAMMSFIQMILWAVICNSLICLAIGMFLSFWGHDHHPALEFCFIIIPLLILLVAAFQVWALTLATLGWVKTEMFPPMPNPSECKNYIFYILASWFFLFASFATQFFVKHSSLFPQHSIVKTIFLFSWVLTFASNIYLVIMMLIS